MNKQDLVKSIAQDAELTKAQSESALNALAKITREALADGGEATLPDIGKLKLAERAARTGRNPRTGESVQIAARTTVKFSAAKALKDAVA